MIAQIGSLDKIARLCAHWGVAIDRQEALHSYFITVVQDLLSRGIVRRRRGQTLEDVLRAEASTVLTEMRADFGAVLGEIGVGLIGAGVRAVETAAHRQIEQIIGDGSTWLSNFLSGRKRA